ncbi:MAG TPA: DUF1016 N-terminal domain-containing protein, partial [bacterium]|nr:DUF1016 N-terminal domain-containing protein [bacterium]
AKMAAASKGIKPGELAPLIAEVRQLIQSARRGAASVVNTLQLMTNFEIGRRIIEYEQRGEIRAAYGDAVVKGLAQALTAEFGTGFSLTNLKLMRKFYLLFSSRIGQTPSDLSLFYPDNHQANIHAREYQLYLPSKELLKQKLLEWTRAEEGRN